MLFLRTTAVVTPTIVRFADENKNIFGSTGDVGVKDIHSLVSLAKFDSSFNTDFPAKKLSIYIHRCYAA